MTVKIYANFFNTEIKFQKIHPLICFTSSTHRLKVQFLLPIYSNNKNLFTARHFPQRLLMSISICMLYYLILFYVFIFHPASNAIKKK